MKAFALVVMSLTFIFVGIFSLSITEDAPFINIAFEAVSAFATTGLSAGLSNHLTDAGKLVIMVMMFIGRLGPLTFIFSLGAPKIKKIRYPEEEVFIG